MPKRPDVPPPAKPQTIAQGRGAASPATGGGRPSKLTPVLRRRLLEALRRGHHLSAACDYAGISPKVFREWMARGEKDMDAGISSAYAEFRALILEATSHAEDDLVKIFHKAGKKDWQASKEFLARRWPHRWGAKVNGGDQAIGPIVPIQIIFRTLPPGYDPVAAEKAAALEAEGGLVEPTPASPGLGSLEGLVEPKIPDPPGARVRRRIP